MTYCLVVKTIVSFWGCVGGVIDTPTVLSSRVLDSFSVMLLFFLLLYF